MSTIVLIHGLWMTPRSREHWVSHYEAKGHTVIAPAYPEVEVEAPRADPGSRPLNRRRRAARVGGPACDQRTVKTVSR